MLQLYTLLVGLSVASFVGSASYRVPRGISIVRPGSFCPLCRASIRAYDLVPVLSYLLLRGRCRSCGGRIPARYVALELALPVALLALLRRVGPVPAFPAYAFLFCALAYLSLVDIERRTLGVVESLLPFLSGAGLLFLAWRGETPFPPSRCLQGAAGGSALVLLGAALAWAFRKARGGRKLSGRAAFPIGAADLLVVPGVSLHFGLAGAVRVVAAASLLGVAAAFALRAAGAAGRDHRYPFLPFLAAGAFLEVLAFLG